MCSLTFGAILINVSERETPLHFECHRCDRVDHDLGSSQAELGCRKRRFQALALVGHGHGGGVSTGIMDMDS